MTIGRTKIKITLDGALVYYYDVWYRQGPVWSWQTELYLCQMKVV